MNKGLNPIHCIINQCSRAARQSVIHKVTIKTSRHFHAGKDGIGGFMSNVVAPIKQVTEAS